MYRSSWPSCRTAGKKDNSTKSGHFRQRTLLGSCARLCGRPGGMGPFSPVFEFPDRRVCCPAGIHWNLQPSYALVRPGKRLPVLGHFLPFEGRPHPGAPDQAMFDPRLDLGRMPLSGAEWHLPAPRQLLFAPISAFCAGATALWSLFLQSVFCITLRPSLTLYQWILTPLAALLLLCICSVFRRVPARLPRLYGILFGNRAPSSVH